MIGHKILQNSIESSLPRFQDNKDQLNRRVFALNGPLNFRAENSSFNPSVRFYLNISRFFVSDCISTRSLSEISFDLASLIVILGRAARVHKQPINKLMRLQQRPSIGDSSISYCCWLLEKDLRSGQNKPFHLLFSFDSKSFFGLVKSFDDLATFPKPFVWG